MSSVVSFLIKWQIGKSDYDITANCGQTFHHPDFWPLYFSELEELNHFGGVMHLCNTSIL